MQDEVSSPTDFLKGLTDEEAEKRRAMGLGNNVKIQTSRSYGQILKENLFTFFNVVLFILGLLLLMMGKASEAVITSGVVIINVIIAVYQEVRAKKKLDEIALLTRPKASVLRNGEQKIVDPSEIVVGDILIAGPGDQILVDGKITGNQALDADESLLTGERDLVHKKPGDTVLSGSFCVNGKGLYQAEKVGAESFANKLTANARTFTREYTPLQQEINLIIRILLAVIVFFCILLTIRAILDKLPFLESVRILSVLFGLAPSSLFLMIVVAYALGAVRIANKGALVQQANSVESLCNVTVLCLDKTGTLTANKIRLDRIFPLDSRFSEDRLREMLGIYARSSPASNPTSEAVAEGCPGKNATYVQEVPFSSSRKWSGLTFDHESMKGTFILGAPEILAQRTEGIPLGSEMMEELTSKGLRVLVLVYSPEILSLYNEKEEPVLPPGLKAICLLSFSDVLRPDTRETLKGFLDSGVKLKIISGDNPNTVAALAKQAGFGDNGYPVKTFSGPQLEKMDQGQFDGAARHGTIFGRITPQQKEQLVKSLRSQGHYVAMTGDGVNDVLALKQANLGIAMQSGSQATRSVAGIILMNDSFSALPKAFAEGQRILNGMDDIFKLYMTRILYLTMLILSIAIINVGFPFTPKQSSIISILTLSIPSFALALWARPGKVVKGSMTQKMMHFVIPAVITMSGAGLFVYLYFLMSSFLSTGYADYEYAQHGLTYITVICGLLLIVFVEPPDKNWDGGDTVHWDKRPSLMSIAMLAVFSCFILIPSWREFYGLSLLEKPMDYILVLSVGFIWAVLLRYTWKKKIIDRYLNIDLNPEEEEEHPPCPEVS